MSDLGRGFHICVKCGRVYAWWWEFFHGLGKCLEQAKGPSEEGPDPEGMV